MVRRISSAAVCAALCAAFFFGSPVLAAEKDGWIAEDDKCYYYENGEPLTSSWRTIAGSRYYFDEAGEMAAGIIVLDEKFYSFSASGQFNKKKTQKIRKAAKYEKSFAPLKKLIGKPAKAKYYKSCYGNGKDGILTYDGYTVYTFKPQKGAEIFMGAEQQ